MQSRVTMRVLCLFLLICLPFMRTLAQQKYIPILERRITLSVRGEQLSTVLTRIEQEGKFSFSYNSTIISQSDKVTLSVINTTVREVLQFIFKDTKNYKEKNGYLILIQTPAAPKTITTVMVITGYVEDEQTGDKVPNASVYDKMTLVSAVTDQFGFYKLKLDQKKTSASLTISKKDYHDTLVSISAPGDQVLNISIAPKKHDSIFVQAITRQVEVDSVEKWPGIKFPYYSEANIQNIRDTLHRVGQVSFLPFVGSNLRLSGNVINDYSFNILGGFSQGTRVAELAGLFNIDRGDVKQFQLAGLFNIVGGNVSGFQLAGLINTNRRKTEAAQVAGLLNLTGGEVDGVQIAGLMNVNKHNVKAGQLAGLFNFNLDSVEGAQVAGLMNVNSRSSRGVQLAGLFNIQHEDYAGSQVAGLINIADKKISGTQLSGIYNLGHHVLGSQIGFLNFSDSIRGIPLGFLSFSTTGYHKIEIAADEIFYTNISFRTGVHQLYNIFTTGIAPDNFKNPLWTIGYGLGTAPRIAKQLYLNIDFTTNHVSKGAFLREWSLLNKLYLGTEFQTKHKVSFIAGFTLNQYHFNDTNTTPPDLFTGYKPHLIQTRRTGSLSNSSLWLGFKVGIRFL